MKRKDIIAILEHLEDDAKRVHTTGTIINGQTGEKIEVDLSSSSEAISGMCSICISMLEGGYEDKKLDSQAILTDLMEYIGKSIIRSLVAAPDEDEE